MKFFENNHIIALTSNNQVDFTPTDFDAPLNAEQQQYLKEETGRDIPQVFWRQQVHGADIIQVKGLSTMDTCKEGDAFITNRPGIPIAIRTADCVPVFLYDPTTNAIGLVHAGWKGTQAQITAKTSKAMQDKFGSKCYHIKAVIGPSIRPCCYQVGPEFISYFPQDVKERNGSYYADMVNANRRQLLETGLKPEHIEDSETCTHCATVLNEHEYFSFRREKEKAGRMISLMMIK
jgi:polyphenol oxidase